MADLALKSQEWLDKSPVIMNSLTKLNQTVPMIKVWDLTSPVSLMRGNWEGGFLHWNKQGFQDLRDILGQLGKQAFVSLSGFCPGLHSFRPCLFLWQKYWHTFSMQILFLKWSVCNMLPDTGHAEACWRPKMSRERSSVCKLTFCLMEWSSQPRPGKKWLSQKMKQYL